MEFDFNQRESVTNAVSAFYDRFPFPDDGLSEGAPPGHNWRWSVAMAYENCIGAALPLNEQFDEPIRILDAGCGTGVSTDYLAHLNPGSEILAIDISKGALQVAKERLGRSGGLKKSSVQFDNISLFNINKKCFFNYINSVGVLHHLDDPLSGLKSLGASLRNGGIIHLFIYAEHGRRQINRVQTALRALDITVERNGVKLTRELLDNLPVNNPIRVDYEERRAFECSSDSHFADMYLHPNERTYSLVNLLDLIEASGLKFNCFSNPNVWRIERLLNGELLERAKCLPDIKQWELIENLDPSISHFELFLSKGHLKKYLWRDDKDVLAAKAKISQYFLGWPGERFYDLEMNLILASVEEHKLMRAVDENPGEVLGRLPLGWDLPQIASIARGLQQNRLLSLSPR